MTEKPVAAGSIWNVNSWHWYMKNYTATAKKLVEEKLLSLYFHDGDITIINTKVRFESADAEVNIRKGKQYLVYEFELDVDYRAENDAFEVNGSYALKDINNNDLDDIVVAEIKTTDKNEISERVKAFLKKNLKAETAQLFKNFAEDLARIESDPAKLEYDRRKREYAHLATHKARVEKGEEKERLLQEQREKEKKMKEYFSKWNQQSKP